MCTLTIAWQVFTDAPVVVAANRDEALNRPSEPPAWVAETDDDPAFVAPRDSEAGGTWVGVNDAGVFVGITNRWIDVEGGGERSRGLLVRDALGASSADEAVRIVEAALDTHRYEGFNLVLADADTATLIEWDGEARVQQLSPGVHVVVNVGIDGTFYEPARRPSAGREQADNAVRLRSELRPRTDEGASAWLERASAALADHEFGVCIHEDQYGTRSSSLITVFDDANVTYQFASGPPCETAYEPVVVGRTTDADESQV